jgi:hypothetical protein
MVGFQTKNPNSGKFCRVLDWKMCIYFMDIWNILWRFEIFYDHLVHFVLIWYIFSGFGIIYQDKFGNPGCDLSELLQKICFHSPRENRREDVNPRPSVVATLASDWRR